MSYALITGASSGIGFELAKLFAKDGIDLILVAKNEQKLEQARSALSQQFNQVKIESFACDLSKPEQVRNFWQSCIAGKYEVEYLVNNAGFSNKGTVLETGLQDEIDLIETNVTALVTLTKLVLPQMVQRNSGQIMNIGSTASFVPLPNQATYGASKAFVFSFSQALSAELRNTKVRVTTLCPGATKTNFFDAAKIQINPMIASSMMTSEQVAKIGYNKMMRGGGVIVAGMQNKAMGLFSKILPSGFTAKSAERVMGIKEN